MALFRSRATGVIAAAVLAVFAGCSATRNTTNTPRTATQQLLVSEAAERALDRLEWPPLAGRSVFVEAVSTGAPPDHAYLVAAAKTRLSESGGFVTENRRQADYLATVVVGSLGTEESKDAFGIPAMQSILLPTPFPEISFFKVTRQEGFAKTELVLRETESGGLLYRAGPTSGATYSAEYSLLFLSFHRSDTSRDVTSEEFVRRASIARAPAASGNRAPLLFPAEE